MDTIKSKFAAWISYFFILLFCYAAISKALDFENFQVQLSQSPLTQTHSVFISYAVIITELSTAVFLSISKLRIWGLHASFTLMFFFSAYIYVILTYSDNIPCSCGGVLENLGWTGHLIFNIVCTITAFIATVINSQSKKNVLTVLIAAEVVVPNLLLAVSIYPITKQNQDHFIRKRTEPFTSALKVTDLAKSDYYFAGNRGDTVFLGNSQTPLLLTTVAPSFDHLKTDTLKLDDYTLKFRSVRISVSYPDFSISDGKVPVIFEGVLPSLTAYKAPMNTLYFSKLVPTGLHEYVFRAVVTRTKESELGIVKPLLDRYTIEPKVLESQGDGIFDTDGSISADQEARKILYTYLYRNEVVSTDFDLKNKQVFNTIDSFSKSKLKVKQFTSGQTKLVQSPQQVNVCQTIWKRQLYNISKIRGRDESFREFSKKIVVDLYDLDQKKYLYSYHLSNDNPSAVKGILRTKKYFYVLTSKHLTRYTYQ